MENVADIDASFDEEYKGDVLSEVASEHDTHSSHNTSQASNEERKDRQRSGRSLTTKSTGDESW